MPGKVFWTVVKLLVACLGVGLILSALGITPADVFDGIFDAALESAAYGREALGWAFQYILIGAAVVIPVWLAVLAFRWINRR